MNKNGVIAVLIFWIFIAIVFFAKPLGYVNILEKLLGVIVIGILVVVVSGAIYALFTNGPNDNSDGFDGY